MSPNPRRFPWICRLKKVVKILVSHGFVSIPETAVKRG